MSALVFVDTNVLIYARQSGAPLNKQKIAAEWLARLWSEQRGRTSVQVLNEYYVTLTRKIRPALTADEAWDEVRALMAWVSHPVDVEQLARAREVERRYRLSWWDSLIVASAQAQGCSLLLTEDLQDRAVLGTLTVHNLFTPGVAETALQYETAPEIKSRHRPRGRPRAAARAR